MFYPLTPYKMNKSTEMPCTCFVSKDACRSSTHTRVAMKPEDFVDRNGKQIKHGDTLMYVNPNFPDKVYPLVAVIYKNDDFYLQADGEEMHHAKSRGRWIGDRFEIIPSLSSR